MNHNPTYFLCMENNDMTPEEEMEDYLQSTCPIPTDEDLDRLYREVWE